jgi:hypothetical protein
MNTKKPGLIILRCFFVTLTTTILFGCGSAKDVDKIGDAQNCLNAATSATAMDCVSKVDGMTSTGAYNIRCAAAFVREGFANPTKYTTAFNTLNGSKSTSFMGLVSFSSTGVIATDTANATTTFNDCYSAGAKGKSLISAFGYFSTALMKFFSDSCTTVSACKTPTATGYDLSACLNGVTAAISGGDPTCAASSASLVDPNASSTSSAYTAQSSIGSVILSTYTISCSGSGANKELCSTLGTAITAGNSEPRAVFRSFFTTSVKP